MEEKSPYQLSVTKCLELFLSTKKWINTEQIKKSRKEYGENKLPNGAQKKWWMTILRQIKDPLMIILAVSAFISAYLGDTNTALVLAVIILFNVVIWFIQEYKADRIMQSLKGLVHPFVNVIREGVEKQIAVENLVPWDIVIIQEWDAIPADLRIIESKELKTNDFALTGESNPAKKFTETLHHKTWIGDQSNMAFMGTAVASGSGTWLVVRTWEDTVLWHIAQLSKSTTQENSPLQKELQDLSEKIMINVLIVWVLLFIIALWLHLPLQEAFLFALWIGMALVPQGLPAQITVALSLASNRLAKQHVVVKKLSSVETLGSTTMICTDKTGTLTKNEMTVQHIWMWGDQYEVTGLWYQPLWTITEPDNTPISSKKIKQRRYFFMTGILASSAHIARPDEYHHTRYTLWDPTEGALITLSEKAGYNKNILNKNYTEAKVYPFDSVRKMMSSIRVVDGKYILFIKGATSSIIEVTTKIFDWNNAKKITKKQQSMIVEQDELRAAEAMRNLSYAYKEIDISQYPTDTSWKPIFPDNPGEIEDELIFLGIVSMIDPPRKEVKEAMKAAHTAGIAITIITWDFATTAKAIAQKVGLDSDGKEIKIITGKELREMSDKEVYEIFWWGHVIFSRTAPEDKLRIVSILKEHWEIIAVTGDGINDAPALKKADIGVAMWLTWTDVSKNAADMILLQDNFSHLVTAIKEWRLIFQNIKKTILSSLTSNGGELFIVLISLLFTGIFDLPIAITPLLILMIDLVGEMGPLTSLTRDPDAGNVMHENPRNIHEHIVNKNSGIDLVRAGFLMWLIPYLMFLLHIWLTNGSFSRTWLTGEEYATAVSVTYLTILFCQYANILSRRDQKKVFNKYFKSNKKLLWSIIISLVLVACILYIPSIGKTVWAGPLRLADWWLAILWWAIYLWIREWQKKRKLRI